MNARMARSTASAARPGFRDHRCQVERGVRGRAVAPALGIHPQEERQGRCPHRDAQVHRARVVADGASGGREQCGQSVEIGRRGELRTGDGTGDRAREVLLAGTPCDEDGPSELHERPPCHPEQLRGKPSPPEPASGNEHRVRARADLIEQWTERVGDPRRAEGGEQLRRVEQRGEEVEPLGELRPCVRPCEHGDIVQRPRGGHRRADDLGGASDEPRDERRGDAGNLPVATVDDCVPWAGAPDGPDARGEAAQGEEPPLEREDAVDRRMSLEHPRGPLVHQEVDGRRRLEPQLQRRGERGHEQRLPHPVVDPDQEDAAEPGGQRAGRPPERERRHPGQGPLPRPFQLLVPGLHAVALDGRVGAS